MEHGRLNRLRRLYIGSRKAQIRAPLDLAREALLDSLSTVGLAMSDVKIKMLKHACSKP